MPHCHIYFTCDFSQQKKIEKRREFSKGRLFSVLNLGFIKSRLKVSSKNPLVIHFRAGITQGDKTPQGLTEEEAPEGQGCGLAPGWRWGGAAFWSGGRRGRAKKQLLSLLVPMDPVFPLLQGFITCCIFLLGRTYHPFT